MSNVKLICPALPGMPWQDRPAGCTSPLWRYSENPVIGRNPIPGVARVFNSAVAPWEGGYIGVFRGGADQRRPLYLPGPEQGRREVGV